VTPGVARAIVVAAAIAAVVAAALVPQGSSAGRVEVRYVFSSDAETLLAPLIERFNREQHDVHVTPVPLPSGKAEAALAARSERPVLWTPASSLWGRLLNYHVSSNWARADNRSLVSSPQVIAMWANLAHAPRWREAKLGWHDVLALATSGRGWAAYGHPEFGAFKLGHTNPDFSTSGLLAVASEYYAVTNKRRGLMLADVRRPDVRSKVRTIERSIVHYGEKAEDITNQMDLYGQEYAHAVYVQETTLLKFNKKRKGGETRLIGVLPSDGTFVADYPLMLLDAPWVRKNTRAAAERFRAWLVPRITRARARASGFRLRPPAGISLLDPPAAEVLTAIRRNWHADRKPANIVLVVDTSASMGGRGRLAAAKLGLLSFLRKLSAGDRVALVTSGSTVRSSVALGGSRSALERAVRSLFARGELPVYGAISRALAEVRSRHDQRRINAIVVLSDGAGTKSGLDHLLAQIRSEPVTEGTSVRIFAVAYGANADTRELRKIAIASRGAFFAGGPSDIQDVYREISSYF
jgi:Ca-activated chloride channel family protein